jgi:nucleotide-binding universal stress UspA family protein
MFEHILFPTDGSDPAGQALDAALEIAVKFDATLHVLSAVEVVPYPEFPDMATVREQETERAKDIVEEARNKATAEGLAVESRIVQEIDPYQAIENYLDEHDIDLIVMGTHGRSGLERLLLGSTTERTLRTADIPVLSVPMKNE